MEAQKLLSEDGAVFFLLGRVYLIFPRPGLLFGKKN